VCTTSYGVLTQQCELQTRKYKGEHVVVTLDIHLLTPWCRVLLEKLTGLQLVKKFPAFHGTQTFITALTTVRQLSLSWANPIQSIYPHPTSWRSILILFTHLRLGLPSGLFPSGFPTKTLYTPLSSTIRATCPAHLFFAILSPSQYWVRSTNHLAPRYLSRRATERNQSLDVVKVHTCEEIS